MKRLVTFLLFLSLMGCEENDKPPLEWEILSDKSKSEKAIEIENELAEQMEIELIQKQRFYQKLEGSYEGVISLGQNKHINLKFVLMPTIPPVVYNLKRIRTREEIQKDLSNLAFNIQVVQNRSWVAFSENGCQLERVEADPTNGVINISSAECPGFYKLRLAEKDPQSNEDLSALIAKDIQDGKVEGEIPRLYGAFNPDKSFPYGEFAPDKSFPSYTFHLKRIISETH